MPESIAAQVQNLSLTQMEALLDFGVTIANILGNIFDGFTDDLQVSDHNPRRFLGWLRPFPVCLPKLRDPEILNF